jgi:heme-degrading monooxygenase HmoA
MFARLTRLSGTPERVAEVETIVREQVLPAAQQLAGFRGLYAMVDRQCGAALSFTLWESEEAMRASEAAANRLRADTAAEGGRRSPASSETRMWSSPNKAVVRQR